VVVQNESPYKLNALWLRADAATIQQYKVEGDTVIVSIPTSAKEIRVDFPMQATGLVLPVSELVKSKYFRLKITSNQQTKDFWETFGNAKIPGYKIERAE
jgi:hypothetical protein